VPVTRRAAMATACPQATRAVSTASRRALVASRVWASARVPRRPRVRAGACVAAAATDDDTLASARALAVPVAEAPEAVPPGPAVFALLDGAGPDATVAYVGVSKRAAADAAAAAAACAAADVAATHVCSKALPANARKPVLRAALAAWLEQAGGVPPGNETRSVSGGETRVFLERTRKEKRTASQALAFELASAAVTPTAVNDLCRDGFVVLDDVFPPETLLAARASAEHLLADGKMRHVGQEGRDDAVAVLDAENMPSSASRYGGLVGAAEALLAFPEALRKRSAEKVGTSSTSSERVKKRVSSSARTLNRLLRVQPPSRLMLAHYPGDTTRGARYVPHLDNDPDDPTRDEGEPGLRGRDRSVTAILYLNQNWEEKDGGCLGVRLENDKGEVDIAPAWGRVVLFDCRRIVHEVRPTDAKRWALTAWIVDGPADDGEVA
jgi:hypothetical protein